MTTKEELVEALIKIKNEIAGFGGCIKRESKSFSYENKGGIITLFIPKDVRADHFLSFIKTKVFGIEREKLSFQEIGYEAGLELLFFHYPYGVDNNSNCVLVNGSSEVLAVQYNGCVRTTTIHIDFSKPIYDIVVNNKKKIGIKKPIHLKEIENYFLFFDNVLNTNKI